MRRGGRVMRCPGAPPGGKRRSGDSRRGRRRRCWRHGMETCLGAIAVLLGVGCGDDAPPDVPPDVPPETPPAVLSRIDAEPAGAHCEVAGAAIRTGHDRDGDGALSDAEIEATSYA